MTSKPIKSSQPAACASSSNTGKKKLKDPLVRREDLSLEIGVSMSTIDRWARCGDLPCPVRIGRVVGWPRSALDNWKVQKGWPTSNIREG